MFLETIEETWADSSGRAVAFANPSLADNPAALAWYATLLPTVGQPGPSRSRFS